MESQQRHLERIADIEASGREANEAVVRVTEGRWGRDMEAAPFRCECGDDACEVPLALPLEVYERARQDPMLFLVRPEHVLPEAETVVERHETHWVIRKNEDVRHVAEARDPRRGTPPPG